MEFIKNLIMENLLLDTVEEDESLFISGKVDGDFLLYLFPILENKYGIVFDDTLIQQKNFDSVKDITKLLERAR
ncbi:MAG TPA: hypothetical protein DCE48_04735 [Lachnospiraceae bacterium]|nr:hypothetical protein [Lachnospiraceae bacterium]